MHTREEIEKIENKYLASYAMKSADSKGREHDNTPHPIRTCYQRDRDRIVHCEAFRKLEYKTQVFVILEGDYYRTRLTHTIEVAQIARTIGRSLRLNEDLIEAIALAHDLGHPPFGHAGERALDEIMRRVNMNFNHNFRSYEIVTRFEKRYPDFSGLDLSREVRVGILKHETVYDQKTEKSKYKDDGPTLEAKVVDIADSLAYLSHDIDDGLTSSCISEKDLKGNPLWEKAYKRVGDALVTDNKDMFKYQIVKQLIDMQTKDLLEYSSDNLKEAGFKTSEDAQEYHLQIKNKAVIDFSPQMKKERQQLQDLLMEKLYKHYRVERMTEKAKRVIGQIFKVYDRNPNQLPDTLWSRPSMPKPPQHEKEEKSADYVSWEKKKYEAICNYIAGMTDRTALDEHKKLFEPYQKV